MRAQGAKRPEHRVSRPGVQGPAEGPLVVVKGAEPPEKFGFYIVILHLRGYLNTVYSSLEQIRVKLYSETLSTVKLVWNLDY